MATKKKAETYEDTHPEEENVPLDPESIDVEDQPNAVPDPWHDTRGVHGDTGNPKENAVPEEEQPIINKQGKQLPNMNTEHGFIEDDSVEHADSRQKTVTKDE